MHQEALDAVVDASAAGNPASLHGAGRAARRTLDACRDQVAQFCAAAGMKVIFTGGGTEATVLGVVGMARAARRRGALRVWLGSLERPWMRACAGLLAHEDMQVERLPLQANGQVDAESLRQQLHRDAAVVALDLSSYDTGVLQPVAQVAEVAGRRGVPVHCHADEAAAWLPIDRSALGVTSLALSAHRLGGPRGVGALICGREVELEPLWGGGPQEEGLRPGTPAVSLVQGFAASIAPTRVQVAAATEVARLRDALERRLLAIEGAFVVGADAPRLANTLAVGFTGLSAARMSAKLSRVGVLVGTGLGPERESSIIRIALGRDVTLDEIETGAELVRAAVMQLR